MIVTVDGSPTTEPIPREHDLASASMAPTLLLRRMTGPAAAPSLAMLAACAGVPGQASTAAAAGTVYALVDVGSPDGDPIGAAFVTAPTPDGSVQLAGLCVAPAYRRRGIGGRILGEVVDVLRGQGVVRVVTVAGGNGAARRLCERAGFTVMHPAGTRLSLEL
jgi:ribosomal protein S18 acetylase RimI-like enzyme